MENDISRGDMIYLSPGSVSHQVAGRGAFTLSTSWDGMVPFWPQGDISYWQDHPNFFKLDELPIGKAGDVLFLPVGGEQPYWLTPVSGDAEEAMSNENCEPDITVRVTE